MRNKSSEIVVFWPKFHERRGNLPHGEQDVKLPYPSRDLSEFRVARSIARQKPAFPQDAFANCDIPATGCRYN